MLYNYRVYKMKGCSIDIGTSGTHAGVKGTTTVQH